MVSEASSVTEAGWWCHARTNPLVEYAVACNTSATHTPNKFEQHSAAEVWYKSKETRYYATGRD